MTTSAPIPAPRAARAIFTEDETAAIAEQLEEALRTYLHPGERCAVGGDLDDDGLMVRIELATPDRAEVGRFSAGAVLGDNAELPLVELRAAAVEFLTAWLLQWLRHGRMPRPHLDFKDYRWEGASLRFRGEVRNDALVAEADRLLREAGFDPDE